MDPNDRQRSSDTLHDLSHELYTYSQEGAKLYLDGIEVTAWEIVEAYRINETGCYMRDYVKCQDGRLEQLRFDKVDDQYKRT
ncbi:MAG: hypothetical protein SPL15_03270 [Lachnospiraceae bacterium]|nr:hypothetical protein [Lachnospiraceae bacterium]MDY5741997.1 hypothetical protein [Lachnospiraceae bacterium]